MARFVGGVLLVLGFVVSGCGQAEPAPAPPSRVYSVEELAAEVGCKPEFQGKGKDFRQAACRTDAARFILFDFETDAKKRVWLNEALIYGGTYLVGEKWILTTMRQADLERMRGEVGGTIEGDPDMHHGDLPQNRD